VSLSNRALAALIAALAFGLAAWSVVFHRHTQSAVGNLCEQTTDNPHGTCFQNLPSGGWPFPYLHDAAGTSVIGKLGPEDRFEPVWFLVDAAAFGAVVASGTVLLRWRRRRSAST